MMAEKKLTLEQAQMKFSEDLTVELLRKGPDRYAPLDREKDGSWRIVTERGAPVAVVWTDWVRGFGVLGIQEGETLSRVQDYEVNAKAVDVSAGWAYTSLETFVNRMKADTVALSAQTEGKLSGAYAAISGREEETSDGSNDRNPGTGN